MITAFMSARGRARFGSSYSVTCDGNSITYGNQASNRLVTAYPPVLATLPILNGAPVINIGVSGQNTAQMLSDRSDVNASWASGKTNVLIAMEGTNSIGTGGRTGVQAAQDMLTYATTVKAANAWTVVLVGTIPRYGVVSGLEYTQPNVDAYNDQVRLLNEHLRDNWRGVADYFIDIQAIGSGFKFPDYTAATFDGSGLYVIEGAGRVHCSDAGYAEIARVIGLGLARLPARAP